MADYTQARRLMEAVTPLAPDTLLLTGFTGREGIAQLFDFRLDLVAENRREVPFDKLLGQPVVVRLSLEGGRNRYFAGIGRGFSQGRRDNTFTHYQLQVVPQLWLLTKRVQSRIFQHLTVPDILKKVLNGLDVAYQIQGAFEPRDYCVQYQESDFDFASRLMEEEGIYYFFKHSASGHQLVVADSPQSHPDLPEQPRVIYEEADGGPRKEYRVTGWEKAQELASGKFTLWDHCFELPHRHLESEAFLPPEVSVGRLSHKLQVGSNDRLEVYHYPGGYAQRFDGIDQGGGERPAELPKIYQDNRRATRLRMQEEAAASLEVRGGGNCRHFVSGYKFTLERHFNADGPYVLTGVEHTANLSDNYRSGKDVSLEYENRFTCLPLALPYRPRRRTPRPRVEGTQTAVVVGPAGEEIFTDKYGRVKVQFHWDRQGKYDADSSCWVRVGTPWAGKQWGMIHLPRVGQEVIVGFEEGDPDRPIVLGSVFNADQMPPHALPEQRMVSGLKSKTHKGEGFNQISFDDTKGKEQLNVHGQFDMNTKVLHDQSLDVKNNRTANIKVNEKKTVGGDQSLTVKGSRDVYVKGSERDQIDGTHDITVGTNRNEDVHGTLSLTAGNVQTAVKGDYALEAAEEIHIKAGKKLVLEAGAEVTLVAPGGFVKIDSGGVTIVGSPKVKINSGGSPGTGKGSKPTSPNPPKQAPPPPPPTPTAPAR
jgi:type VI secretion system secreted protein VgrG